MRFTSHVIVLFALVLSLGHGHSLAQGEKVPDELSAEEIERMQELRSDFEAAAKQLIQTRRDEPVMQLSKSYINRMNQLLEQFSKNGELEKALAARAASKQEPTPDTVHTEIEQIASLQRTFLDGKVEIQQQFEKAYANLAKRQIEKLTLIQSRLTKLKRLNSAVVVADEIRRIKADPNSAQLIPLEPAEVYEPNPDTDFRWGVISPKKGLTQFVYINGLSSQGRSKLEIVIPQKIQGKAVKWVSGFGNSNAKFIVIPKEVTIQPRAFYECRNLIRVILPPDLKLIPDRAFYRCPNLSAIDIPDSVTDIASQAFSGCEQIGKIKIGNSVAHIGDGAFYGCKALTELEIPKSVLSIGQYAFSGPLLNLLIFRGDAPQISVSSFSDSRNLRAYRMPNANGWRDKINGTDVRVQIFEHTP